MPDIPGNSSTTRSITVGGTLSDSLEVVNDHDWVRLQLTAGQSVSVSLDGISLVDPYLRIRDSSGAVIYENDDISAGVNRDSLVAFTATYTGTYFIDVAAWVPPSTSPDYPGYTGTYQLSVSTYTPPPLGTTQQLADYLVSGYWDGEARHFNVTQGGSITVNISGLSTSAGQSLAIAALASWTDIIGVNFIQVSGEAQIEFTDNEDGAFSTSAFSNGIISSSHVNVSEQWLSDYGTTINSYSYQTFIHEIGHALGLGHQGGYNGDARYPYDAVFQNDSWAMSVMSYFDQQDNTYFAGQGFDVNYALTPMMADILAMSMMYGLSTSTRPGNSVYTAYGPDEGAVCVFDSGGTDTISAPGYAGAQLINLNAGTFSNLGGSVGNLSIALGVTIENAIGAQGADTIIGNSANNSLDGAAGNDALDGSGGDDILIGGAGTNALTGGAGNDIFQDTAANLNGDTITDFAAGDKIVISDASLAGFSYSVSGSTLTYTGGSLTLTGFAGQLQASAAVGGGVQLTVAVAAEDDVRNDFNGDGYSDVVWRHGSGAFSVWSGQADGGFVASANSNATIGTSWKVAGSGDFNGDGFDDVLWRHDSGAFSAWLGRADGGFVASSNSNTVVATNWQVAGTGDFNGDNRDDIIWRDDSGGVMGWLGQANGGFSANPLGSSSVASSWEVAGTGDFNGDGRHDVLWRSDSGAFSAWHGQSDGGFVASANSNSFVGTSWHIVGTGDFNGDDLDDVLWRSDSGAFSAWHGQSDGGFVASANSNSFVGASWHVAGTGDYNGDGRDDIVWRDDGGAFSVWHGLENGGFVASTNSNAMIDNSWKVQPDYLV